MWKDFSSQMNHMLQGVVYWMAYKNEVITFDLIEADIVNEAATILSARLSDYYVKREVNYSKIDSSLKKQFADLGIFSRKDNSCKCIIEFKLGDNGGYRDDVKKVNELKKKHNDIICLVVIAFRKNCSDKVLEQYVTDEGNAKRGVIKSIPGTQVRVRRVCKAPASKDVRKMKKMVCLEVL
jgi:hypothetical protein